MLEGTLHSFEGGMNKDLSSSKRQPNVYWEGNNITLTVSEDTELGDITVPKGNEFKFVLPRLEVIAIGDGQLNVKHPGESALQTYSFADLASTTTELSPASNTGQKIVGYTFIRDTLILFTTTNSELGGVGCIWKYNPGDTNPYLVYAGVLNFSMDNPIQAIGNYESSTIQKVYWVDGVNELRSINIADSNAYKLPVNKIDINGNISLTNISLDTVGRSGSFSAGVVQYAYQYYNTSGSESALSPVTNPIPISDSLVQGNESTETINKSFDLSITIDTQWDKIRVFRILYTDNLTVPTISVIVDQVNAQNLSITDDGSLFLYSFDLLAFTLISKNSFKPQGLVIKDQRLFAYNYTEEVYSPDWDSRAYRFPVNSTTTDILHNGQTVTLGTGFQSGGQNIPDNYDCINPDNANKYFDPTTDQMYKQSSSTSAFENLGASGPNVTISFTTESIRLDNSVGNNTAAVISTNSTADPINSQKRSWRRDEIYRVAVVLIDNKGRKSLPKWICDLRMPSAQSSPITEHSSGNANSNYIYPVFEFKNLPSDCQGVEVVRVERTDVDKTILSQGYMLPTIYQLDELYPSGRNYLKMLEGDDFYVFEEPNDYSSGDRVYIPNDPSYPDSRKDTIWFVNSRPGLSVTATQLVLYSTNITNNPSHSSFSNDKFVGELMNSVNGGEAQFGESPISFWGVVENKVLAFYSPEISINKTINQSPDNYFNYSQQLSSYNSGVVGGLVYYEGSSVTGNAGMKDVDTDYSASSAKDIYNFEKYLIQTAGFDERTFDIEDTVLLKPDESGVLSNGTYSINNSNHQKNVNILNVDYIFNERKGTALFVLASEVPDFPVSTYSLHCVNYKKPLVNQYGGQTYDVRFNNNYIPASEFKAKSGSTATVTAKYGDTFISEWNHFPSYYRSGSVCRTNSVLLAVETDYDLSKHLDTDMTNLIVDGGIADRIDYIKNNWREFDGNGNNRNYKVNEIYQKQNNIITNFNNDTTNTVTNFETTVRASNSKIPNESVDSWLNFPALNFLDINGSYGPINHIAELNDNLIYFQDNAIGVLSINPRYTVQSDEGDAVIGTGGILDDFKYLSTSTGCKHRWSIIKGAKMLYYFDEYDNEIKTIDGTEISTATGIKSELNKSVQLDKLLDKHTKAKGIITGYDRLRNLVFFTFKQDTDSFTLVLNENLGLFETLLDACPTWWININKLYSVTNNDLLDPQQSNAKDSVWEEGIGELGKYYGTYVNSDVTILSSPKSFVTKVGNNIEWDTEVKELGIDKPDVTFDTVRFYTDHQDTGVKNVSDIARRRLRMWRAFIPRNEGGSDRLRDLRFFIKFSFLNDGFKKLKFRHLKFFFSYEPNGI